MASSDYYIGLMSGTSVDAIDVVLVRFDQQGATLEAQHSVPLSTDVKDALLALALPGHDELNRLARVDVEMGVLFAQAVIALLDKTNITADEVHAIGSHGQTLRHIPASHTPTSIQIGDPNIIAEHTGITTVADFRRRDMAAGGQGAPLVPAFHKMLFQLADKSRIVLNIGGIANITLLPTDPAAAVSGFDTGPGNVLMDAWVQQHLNLAYDRKGEWGASGGIHPGLLERMLYDPYFSAPPPKSTGREYFNLQWLNPLLHAFPSLATRDVQATLCELTARSIADAIQHYAPDTQDVLVCGGGVHNTHLMQRLEELLTPIRLGTTSNEGLDPEWIEAMAFAWLAKQTLEHKAGNIPTVTGARHPVVLGGIYLGREKGKA